MSNSAKRQILKDFDNYLPLWKYGLSNRVCSFDELDSEIKRLIYDKEERDAFIRKINRNLYLFNYNDDGLASKRIAERLSKIAQASKDE